MITPEMRTTIRSLFFGRHFPVGTIATQPGVHNDTVRAAVEIERFATARPPRPARPSVLDPYKVLILDTLAEYPTLRATRLHDIIRDHGYTGTAVTVRRFVRRHRPSKSESAYLRLRTLPGEQGQVDWACFGRIRIGRANRALSCFVMVLSYSRAIFARFFLDQMLPVQQHPSSVSAAPPVSAPSFLRAARDACSALRGILGRRSIDARLETHCPATGQCRAQGAHQKVGRR